MTMTTPMTAMDPIVPLTPSSCRLENKGFNICDFCSYPLAELPLSLHPHIPLYLQGLSSLLPLFPDQGGCISFSMRYWP